MILEENCSAVPWWSGLLMTSRGQASVTNRGCRGDGGERATEDSKVGTCLVHAYAYPQDARQDTRG